MQERIENFFRYSNYFVKANEIMAAYIRHGEHEKAKGLGIAILLMIEKLPIQEFHKTFKALIGDNLSEEEANRVLNAMIETFYPGEDIDLLACEIVAVCIAAKKRLNENK